MTFKRKLLLAVLPFACSVAMPVSALDSGDVFARAYVRWLEIQRSVDFIRGQLAALPGGVRYRATSEQGLPLASENALRTWVRNYLSLDDDLTDFYAARAAEAVQAACHIGTAPALPPLVFERVG